MDWFKFGVILLVVFIGFVILKPTYDWYFNVSEADRNLLSLPAEEVSKLSPELKKKYTDIKKLRSSTILNLGLDLRGGVYITLEPDPVDMTNFLLDKYEGDINKVISEYNNELESQVSVSLEILRNRLDQFGVTEPVIRKESGYRISVELPGISSIAQAREAVSKAGKLEFRFVDDDYMANVDRKYLNELGLISDLSMFLKDNTVPADSEIYGYYESDEFGLPTLKGFIVLKREVVLDGSFVSDARVGQDQFGRPVVDFSLTLEGADIFAEITRNNIGKRLAIVLDGRVRSAPVIQTEILGGRGQITGVFTQEEVNSLVSVLKSGALSVRLKEVEIRAIGPSLGADSISLGTKAAVIGILLVFAFAMIYYKTFGFITTISLIMNLFLTLAGLALFRATLTLPGIAGLALTIGMAIDANVLQFERIKEELRNGKDLVTAIRIGFDRAFITIIDTHVTVIISSFILATYGYGPIKGFGTTLLVGIVVSLFTSVFVVRFLVDFVVQKLKIRFLPALV
ncbi:MAG: protein translocase subunit SecD [Brevinematales bacterium]|nr:protein translocase subunit SecD [Brevinematales bacterium]